MTIAQELPLENATVLMTGVIRRERFRFIEMETVLWSITFLHRKLMSTTKERRVRTFPILSCSSSQYLANYRGSQISKVSSRLGHSVILSNNRLHGMHMRLLVAKLFVLESSSTSIEEQTNQVHRPSSIPSSTVLTAS
jgi:hypothetical protein